MSAEVGVVFLMPAVIGIAAGAVLIGGLADLAGNALAERQRRSLAAADRITGSMDEYRLLAARIARERERFGDKISELPVVERPSAGADLQRAAAESARIDAIVAEAMARFQAEVGAARAGQILAGLAESISQLRGPQGPREQRHTAVPGEVVVRRREEVAVALRRVLGRIDPDVGPALVATLERRAADAVAVPEATTAQRLLDDLRYTVDQANIKVIGRRDRLRRMAGRLEGLEGPSVDNARNMLAAARHDPEPDLPGLERLVGEAVERAVAPAVRAYGVHALRESLQELGIAVEEDFEVALAGDGIAHLQRPGWEDLAVRVRSRPEENSLHFNLVTPRDGEASDVTAAEQQWCGAVDELIPALAARGVEVGVTHRSIEGEAVVQEIDPVRYPFDRRRRTRRTTDTQRELPR
jgi:hypothetical protein